MTNLTAAIAAAVQDATGTSSAAICDTKRPLKIRNWIGFLGTCNRVLDSTNVEFVVKIRYAPAIIVFKGLDETGTATSLTAGYTIDNYYMTIQKLDLMIIITNWL